MTLPAVADMLHAIAAQPRLAVRQSIQALAEHMLNMPEAAEPAECPVKHMFAPGMYVREITMPAGMLVIGKIHRHAHVNIISKGAVEVVTEHGACTYTAPCSFVSEPGTQRVVHILEECIWATVHATSETDLAEIESEIIAEDFSEIELTADYEEVPQ